MVEIAWSYISTPHTSSWHDASLIREQLDFPLPIKNGKTVCKKIKTSSRVSVECGDRGVCAILVVSSSASENYLSLINVLKLIKERMNPTL
jgi:hypothetical protein